MIVISGPTCTGKTKLGLEIAQECEMDIISADSRQIYKFMDYGTGKVPVDNSMKIIKKDDYWLTNGVKIYGYDLVAPDERFSAYEYKEYFESMYKKNINLIMVGGTGFYIDTAIGLNNLSPVEPDQRLREELEKLTTEQLIETLENINKEILKDIDIKNKYRLIRAIEKAKGKYNVVKANNKPDILVKYIGLTSERTNLYENADGWVDSIYDHLISETMDLITRGYKDSAPLKGFLYDQSINVIEGSKSKEDAKIRMKFDMHHYIRRQLTWFKRNNTIQWFDIKDPSKKQKIKNLVELDKRENG